MACATAMLHFGMTIWILTLARVFQGISAAILYSAGLALLYDSVGNDKIGYAMGYVTMAFTAGTVIGPSLGGILYQYGREPAVFGLAYAVIAIDIVLRSLVIEKDTAKKYGLEAAGPGYGTIDANPPEPTPAPDPHMLKSEVRFPSLLLLKTPRLLTALFGWLVVGILLTAFDAVLPLFVGSTFSWSTAGAGVIFLPVFLPNIASPLYGRLVDSSKHAVRLVAAFGFTFNLPFFVLLRLAAAHKSLATQVLFCVLLFLIGLGLALCGPPLFVEVARVVAMFEEERGPGAFGGKGVAARAYGLFNCAFAAGQVLGPLWAGAVKEAYGWATMAWMLGVVSGVTGLVMGLFLGGWVGDVIPRRKEGTAEVDS
ncbi:hypothetical protein MMC12_006975 [Toensbergia leucococca]|nr:hypothetical protein [Toensbergia leucococca]